MKAVTAALAAGSDPLQSRTAHQVLLCCQHVMQPASNFK